jgi:amidase
MDAAIALDAMSGYEPGDHNWLGDAAQPFTRSALSPPPRLPIQLALDAPLGVPVDDEPRSAARRAAALLAELGHDVSEGSPDWSDERFPSAWATFATTTLRHIVRVLERLHGRDADIEQLEPATRHWLLGEPSVDAIDYLEAREHLCGFARRVLRSWPRDGLLITPTLTRLPQPIGATARPGVTDDAVRFSALVRIWNVTGQPAVSLPLHETADGIPVGVQVVGPPARDDLVLAVAAQLEAAAGGLLGSSCGRSAAADTPAAPA